MAGRSQVELTAHVANNPGITTGSLDEEHACGDYCALKLLP